MRVGVDLDGVIYDFVAAFRNYRSSKGIPFESMPDPSRYEMWNDWGLSKHEFYESMAEAETAGLFHQGQAYPDAIEGVRRLKADGHSIHIITHRLRPHAQTSTIGWLATHEVPYDTLTFSKEKDGYPIDVCIEDQPQNAEAVEQSGVPCYLITRSWNADVPWKRRVETWEEFVQLVSSTSVERPDPTRKVHDSLGDLNTENGEVRETSPTGGEKGSKPEQYSMIPVPALAEVSRVYTNGAQKYARNNWRKGYRWSLSYDALQRHVNAFWEGEDFNPDSGLHHLAHAVFHCFTLMSFGGDLERYDRYDDRHREVPGY